MGSVYYVHYGVCIVYIVICEEVSMGVYTVQCSTGRLYGPQSKLRLFCLVCLGPQSVQCAVCSVISKDVSNMHTAIAK